MNTLADIANIGLLLLYLAAVAYLALATRRNWAARRALARLRRVKALELQRTEKDHLERGIKLSATELQDALRKVAERFDGEIEVTKRRARERSKPVLELTLALSFAVCFVLVYFVTRSGGGDGRTPTLSEEVGLAGTAVGRKLDFLAEATKSNRDLVLAKAELAAIANRVQQIQQRARETGQNQLLADLDAIQIDLKRLELMVGGTEQKLQEMQFDLKKLGDGIERQLNDISGKVREKEDSKILVWIGALTGLLAGIIGALTAIFGLLYNRQQIKFQEAEQKRLAEKHRLEMAEAANKPTIIVPKDFGR